MTIAFEHDSGELARDERVVVGPRRARGPTEAAELRRLDVLTATMEAVMERHDCAVIQFDRFGRITHLTAVAAGLLEAYCRWRGGSSLPLTIEGWRRSDAPPLIIEAPRGRLRLWTIDGRRWQTIVLEEQRSSPPEPGRLEEFGLTRRQAQVLSLLAAGKCNEQIGRELAISRATVSKHLERIYSVLGVCSRSQAIARVHG